MPIIDVVGSVVDPGNSVQTPLLATIPEDVEWRLKQDLLNEEYVISLIVQFAEREPEYSQCVRLLEVLQDCRHEIEKLTNEEQSIIMDDTTPTVGDDSPEVYATAFPELDQTCPSSLPLPGENSPPFL